MTLNYQQLMETNLKGYKFIETEDGYTMTGWGTIDRNYIVIEDNGQECVVADLKDRTRAKTWPKKTVATKLSIGPILKWDDENRRYVNNIEQL